MGVAMGQTVEIPVALYNKWLRAGEALNEWRDALEDFLMVNNPGLLRRLRKARQEQLSGKTRPWAGIHKYRSVLAHLQNRPEVIGAA
jgi:hypothetical protein